MGHADRAIALTNPEFRANPAIHPISVRKDVLGRETTESSGSRHCTGAPLLWRLPEIVAWSKSMNFNMLGLLSGTRGTPSRARVEVKTANSPGSPLGGQKSFMVDPAVGLVALGRVRTAAADRWAPNAAAAPP